jgi:hypothetical protein
MPALCLLGTALICGNEGRGRLPQGLKVGYKLALVCANLEFLALLAIHLTATKSRADGWLMH